MKTSFPSTCWLPPDVADASFQVITCFAASAAGVCHRVLLNPSPDARQACLDQRDRDQRESEILVLLWLGERGARAEFYQAGHAIRRCGSGTLAAAHVLSRELALPLTSLETEAADLPLQARGEYLGYANIALSAHAAGDHSFWSSLLDQPASDCQLIGGADDYCLLELDNERAVGGASVDLDALGKGRRALVLTARAHQQPFHYVFRYFAPQYGIAESDVTASVNIDLGRFWFHRLKLSHLLARQLSGPGAEFRVEVEEERVWVFGQTRLLKR